MVSIRLERPDDASYVRIVNERAFGQPAEADLVDTLRRNCVESLSLVAEDDGIVGHVLFTPVVIEAAERSMAGMGLAPMAPDAAFMVLVLDANAMAGVSGVARYRNEFDETA